MPTLPNPFDTGQHSAAPVEAAALPKPSGEDGAAADIPLNDLISRGFDPDAFVSDCEPLPAFLCAPSQAYSAATEMPPVLAVLSKF